MESFVIKEVVTIPFVETLARRDREYFKEQVQEIYRKHVEENNILWESIIVDEQEHYEQACVSPEIRIGFVIRYRGRKRTDDDDQRERIEFMIKNIS